MTRRFAIVHCYVGPKWEGGSTLWSTALSEPGDEFVIFNASARGEVPPLEDARSGRWAGVIVTGSQHAATDDVPWIIALTAFLRECLAAHAEDVVTPLPLPPPRLLGGCFGAQLIAHAAGGTVLPMGFFCCRAEAVTPLPAFAAAPYARGIISSCSSSDCITVAPIDARATYPVHPPQPTPDACTLPLLLEVLENGRISGGEGSGGAGATEVEEGIPRAPPCTIPAREGAACDAPGVLRVLESHGDHVAVLPPGATLLATSRSCNVEVFALGPPGRHYALAYQSHPEFELVTCILDCVWPRVMGKTVDSPLSRRLTPADAASAAQTFALPRHDAHLLEIARRFLKRVEA